MKRRDFLKTGGIVGTAGIVFDGCGQPQQLIPLLVGEDRLIPGEEAWVRTLCQQCSAGCGITVRIMQGESLRTIDGQPKRVKAVQAKKIEGNPDHPVSRGGTCARGQAGIQALYHPDRIRTPLRLSGPRGSAEYQPIGWTEALKIVVAQIQALEAEPQSLALLTGRPRRGTMGALIERFAAGVGTRNVISYDPFDPAPIRKAMELTTGIARLPGLDFANANYLLSFNANLFETFLSPVTNIFSYGEFRQGRPGLRGKFVHAEPRLSQTAACADEWLPIRPGTEGLAALSMAHVIVGEKLYDAAFVEQRTEGFPEFAAALAPFAPHHVASRVDVPAERIERIAREFAARRPSVAVGDSRHVESLTAINALNWLVGAFGRPGGILLAADERSGPVPAGENRASPATGSAQEALPHIHALINAMRGNEIKSLFVIDSNPLFSLPESDKLRAALARVPFIVSFASFLDETAAAADLILPAHDTLERWVDDVPEPGVGFPVRTIGQPVVEPRWDTRDPGDVLIELARALGGNAAAALPFENMAEGVKESFRSVHAQAHGDADFDAFFKSVTDAGGWWQPPSPEGEAPRASDRRAAGRVRFIVPSHTATPTFAGDPQQHPYMLHIYSSPAFTDGRNAHLPWLQEMPDPMTTVMWQSWVELSPETAAKLDVREGDVLAVTSPHGTIELPAFVYPGLRPDVIAIPVGQGHTRYGRYAENRGANPLRLSKSVHDAQSGAVVQTGVRVSIAKTGRTENLIRFGASDARPHHEHPLHR